MATDTQRPSPLPPPIAGAPAGAVDRGRPPARVPRLPSPRQRASRWLRALPSSGPAVAAALVALTAASALLRTRQLHVHYWIDEAISVGIASHPLSQLHELLRQDGSPPLYYLLLHGWMALFGRGEVATHLLSDVFALAAVPVAWWGGLTLFGRRVGAYSAVLAAGLPFLTTYGQETRMYSLVALLSLVVAISFVHAFVHRRRRYLPLLSLSLTAALYTHNWALFLVLGTFVAFVLCARATPAPRAGIVRDGALAFGAVAIAYLPWVPTLLYQAGHTGAPWALPPVVWSVTEGLYFLTGGRGAAVALALAGGAGLVALSRPSASDRRTAVAAAALAILGFGTLLIAWGYAKTTPAWSGRYLAVIVGPLTPLLGLGLARARGLGAAALILVCCFWVLDPHPTSPYAKSNVAAVARAMRAQTGPGTLVLSTQPEEVPTLAYYMPRVREFATPLGRVPDPLVMDWRNALRRFERSSARAVLGPIVGRLAPGQRVLLVVPAGFERTPEWMALIRRASLSWERYLRRDPRLRLERVAAPHAHAANVGVRGELFAVTGR